MSRCSNHLVDRLLASETERPHRVAITTDTGTTWRYDELIARSAQFAHALVSLDVAAGDRVAVCVPNSINVIALHLAVLRVGAVYVPMNTAYTQREVAMITADCDAAVVIVETAGRPHEISMAALNTLADTAAVTFENVGRAGDDYASILYTSGTTGTPKGAVMTHASLAWSASTLGTAWGFCDTDRLVHVLPLFHTHGLFVATYLPLMFGASISLHRRFDVAATLDDLAQSTVMMGVPTHYIRLLNDERLTPELCGSMRLFTSGSAPMLAGTHAAFTERTGRHIVERYGMTETCILTSNPLDGPWKTGTVGPALPGIDLRVSGQHDNGVGSIEVRGPNLLASYWGRPEATAASYTADGWFVTGDLGRFDADGYVEIVGRAKDLIITGGLNVYPKEVEQVIDSYAGVIESAVFGVPDDDFGEQVVAAIVVDDSTHPWRDAGHDSTERLTSWCNERLARFKVPRRLIVVDSLPRNTMGKVQKVALASDYQQQ